MRTCISTNLRDTAHRLAGTKSLKDLTVEEAEHLKVEFIKSAFSMMVEAGLKDDFMNLLKKGKAAWDGIWKSVDRNNQGAIKDLKTVDGVKSFTAKNPALKTAVLCAVLLGYTMLPTKASAELIPDVDLDNLVNSIRIEVVEAPQMPRVPHPPRPVIPRPPRPITPRPPQPGVHWTLSATLPQGWASDFINFSAKATILKTHVNEQGYSIVDKKDIRPGGLSDLFTNRNNLFAAMEKVRPHIVDRILDEQGIRNDNPTYDTIRHILDEAFRNLEQNIVRQTTVKEEPAW